MEAILETSFRGVDHPEHFEDIIKTKAEKLEQVCGGGLTSIRLSLEREREDTDTANPYRVRLTITMPPRHEAVIVRETVGRHKPEDIPVILREAFDAARRKVKKVNEKRQGKVKSHPEQTVNAVVKEVFPAEDYGFLRSLDDRDVYFHRNSVVGRDFDDLKPGIGVAYTQEIGDQGLRASSVRVIDGR